jgi:hypothetical protein
VALLWVLIVNEFDYLSCKYFDQQFEKDFNDRTQPMFNAWWCINFFYFDFDAVVNQSVVITKRIESSLETCQKLESWYFEMSSWEGSVDFRLHYYYYVHRAHRINFLMSPQIWCTSRWCYQWFMESLFPAAFIVYIGYITSLVISYPNHWTDRCESSI